MQAQCQFTAQRFDTLIPALRFKKFDAVIAGMEVIPMREKQVAFSRPYRRALRGSDRQQRCRPYLCRSEG